MHAILLNNAICFVGDGAETTRRDVAKTERARRGGKTETLGRA